VSDARSQGFLEASPDAVIVVDQSSNIVFASNRVNTIFGYHPDELVGKSLSVLIPVRYRRPHEAHLGQFMKDAKPRMMGEGVELPALRKDGSEFPSEVSLSPYRTDDGLVVIAAIRDVTVRSAKAHAREHDFAGLQDLLGKAEFDVAHLMEKAGMDAAENAAAKQLQQLLLEELHHRVKNTLATVIAITSQSLRTAESLQQGQLAVENRMAALGRAQDLLLSANSTSAQLTDVIRSAIDPFGSSAAQRFTVHAFDIEINPTAILPLSISFNELCTNAVKYGALSNTMGHVDIRSSVDENAQRFKLTWTETGGPAVEQPTRRSFGTRLLDRLAQQLHGEIRLRYIATGVIYELDIPLVALRLAKLP
jgi:PAS domain S-box-containing protein